MPRNVKPKLNSQPRETVERVVHIAISPDAASILLDVFDKIELTGRPDEIVNAIYEDVAEQLTGG